MREILFDTDMGVDCDDAVALSLLLSLEQRGRVRLCAVTTSSTRTGSSAAVRAILNHYGRELPLAHMRAPVLPCDCVDNYGRALMARYHTEDSAVLPVPLMRKTLAERRETVLLATGPLSNVAELLQSGADTFSPLTGEALVRERVKCVYAMAGRFDAPAAEFNVQQDPASARYVAEHCPVPIVFVPFEAGHDVLTGSPLKNRGDHPAWYAMRCFFVNQYGVPFEEIPLGRESWDPIAALLACGLGEELFVYERGTVSVGGDGVAAFRAGEGNRYVVRTPDRSRAAAAIDGLL